MPEDFKVVAVVKFNNDEALVLNRPIDFVYHEDGRSFIGEDGPFRDFLGYEKACGRMKAFAGRELTLKMADGTIKKIKDDWWSTWKGGYRPVTVNNLERLKECYVFHSAHITQECFNELRSGYDGPVYPYWDYEKVIKYDSEHKKWIERSFQAEDKLRNRNKRDALISNLLIGRSILLHAIKHLREYERIKDLKCTLGPIYGADDDHIGKWKKAGKEYGFSDAEDEQFEMNECPRCSAEYASYQARKILKNRLARINGILTRLGNSIREGGKMK